MDNEGVIPSLREIISGVPRNDYAGETFIYTLRCGESRPLSPALSWCRIMFLGLCNSSDRPALSERAQWDEHTLMRTK